MSQEEWKTPVHRKKVVEQIEQRIRNPGEARKIENASYSKAKNREEYLTLVKGYLNHYNNAAKKETMMNMHQAAAATHGTVQDPMMAMQAMPNRGQGIVAGGQQMQMGQNVMQGIPPNMQGQSQVNIQQQTQLNLMRQKQLQQQLQQQQQQQQQHNIQMNQATIQANMGNFNPTQAQIIRQANFVSPTGQPTNQMARPAPPVFPGQPTPPQHQPGMVPSPAYSQQMSPAGAQPGAQQVLSPATYIQHSPSPQQPQSMPSPGMRAVPSPSTSLNTPGNPASVGSAPSPGSAGRGPGSVGSSPEEHALLREKKGQLASRIELLKKQTALIKDQDKVNKRMKLVQVFTDVLNSNDLNKINQLLQKFNAQATQQQQQQQAREQVHPGQGPAPAASSTKSNQMFQPLLSAINEQINSPNLNHNLEKAFGPAMNKILGHPSSFTAPILRRAPVDQPSSHGVPDIVQGEVARLPPKFKVSLDPAHLPDSGTVHLLCQLEDDNLPSVPPVGVLIPEKYPTVNPQYNVNAFYCQTQFHQHVHKMLIAQLSRMPDLYTFTQLMDAWEMSVRRCCQVI